MSKATSEIIREFFMNFPERQVPKGELLIWADNEPEFVYYILQGRIRQYDIIDDGRKLTVNSFGAGAYLPMSWAINRGNNDYFYETIEDSILRCAPPDEVVKLLSNNPKITLELLGRVFSGSDGVLKKMTYMMVNNALKRIAFELSTECKRAQNHNPGSNLVALNEIELAMHTGLARETVNRQLAKLKAEGIVTVTKAGIVIDNLSALDAKI